MRNLLALVSAVAAIGVASANAQTPVYPNSGNVYQSGGYYGQPRASTVGESHMRGMSDVMRSTGQANLDNSAAAINYTQARSNQIDNQYKTTETYFAMREVNRAAQAAERGPRSTMEQLNRRAQRAGTQRLSPGELDAVTGRISWPMYIRAKDFDADRAALEQIFAKRSTYGALGPEDYEKAVQLTKKIQDGLNDKLAKKQIPQYQWTGSQTFLKSLGYEASLPAA